MSDRIVPFYVGNLKRAERFYSLNWHHFLMAAADEYGNLLKKNILVQFIGCKIDGKIKSLLLCNECNEECSSLQQILMRGELSETFYNRIVENYCIHCRVCIEFNPTEIFPINESFFPWVFGPDLVDIQVLQEKPLLCAVLSGGSYGLISLPPRAKYIRCVYPCKDSTSCRHVKTYNHHVEKEKEEIEPEPTNDLLSSFIDLDINGEELGTKTIEKPVKKCFTKPKKLEWPPSKESQQEFRKLANCDYSQLVD